MNATDYALSKSIKELFRAFCGLGKSRSTRRRSRRSAQIGIECLEGRLYLSSQPIPSSVQVGVDGSLYHRYGNPQDAGALPGTGGIALEGGGTDVDQAFQWMISRMGGTGDFLVLRSYDSPGYNSYIYDFGGVNSVSTLVIPNRAAAMDPAVAQIIRNADAIFIGGGVQGEYLDFWKGTPVQAAISTVISRGVPIGGTSAGTDVLSQYIYTADYGSMRSSQAMLDPFDPNLTMDQNFINPLLLPQLKNTLVDTHFENRDRMGRMVALLARVNSSNWSANQRPQGIGINEETALLITPNGMAQVVGNSDTRLAPAVDFFQTPGLPQVAQPGQPLTYTSLLVNHITAGGSFNLRNWGASFTVNNPFNSLATASVIKGYLTVTPLAVVSPLNTTPLIGVASVAVVTPTALSLPPTGMMGPLGIVPVVPIAANSKSLFSPTSFTDSYASLPGTVVSLRDAIVAANNSTATGTVTINLKGGTYSLTRPQSGLEDGTDGDLVVNNTIHTLVINGTGTSGPGATMIDASLLEDRVFQLFPGTNVILNHLIITGGYATDDGVFGEGPARGGAILDNGNSLTLNNVWVVGNRAIGAPGEDAQGGGIYSSGGKLAIYRSTIATNQASGGSGVSGTGGNAGNGQGGGIFASAGSVILGTAANPVKILSNNAVGGTGGSGATGGNGGNAQGGGVFVGGGSMSLSLTMSHAVFSSNFAYGGSGGSASSGAGGSGGNAQGAGLYCAGNSYNLVNSDHDLFQSNRASGGAADSSALGGAAQGAGIYLAQGAMNLTLDILSNNVALGGNGQQGGAAQGAGAYISNNSSPVSLVSNLFLKNVALGGVGQAESGGAGQGGGVFLIGGSTTTSPLKLLGNLFQWNSAIGGSGADLGDAMTGGDGGDASGGGLFVSGFSITLSSVGNVFLSNRATGGRGGTGSVGGSGGWGQGGAVFLNETALNLNSTVSSSPPVQNSQWTFSLKSDVMQSNLASGGTGGHGIAAGHGGDGGHGEGGGMFLGVTLSPQRVMKSNVIGLNTAQGGRGGGVFSGGIGGDGGAGLGGGIFASQSQPALETNVVSGNTVMGGGVGLAATNGVKGLAKGPNVYFGTVLIPVALHTMSLESNPKKVG